MSEHDDVLALAKGIVDFTVSQPPIGEDWLDVSRRLAQEVIRLSSPAPSGERKEEHPEAYCDRCRCPNITWFAPSPLWNKAIAGTHHDILCPVCFIQLAEAAGIHTTAWKVTVEDEIPPEVVQELTCKRQLEWALSELGQARALLQSPAPPVSQAHVNTAAAIDTTGCNLIVLNGEIERAAVVCDEQAKTMQGYAADSTTAELEAAYRNREIRARLAGEVERLTIDRNEWRTLAQDGEHLLRRLRREPEGARDAVIEECAKVADMHAADCANFGSAEKARTAASIADMLRALASSRERNKS